MIPKFKMFIKPVLEILEREGGTVSKKKMNVLISEHFHLSKSDLLEQTSRKEPVVANRVSWASVYLVKAGMITRPDRGILQITDRGRSLLLKGYDIITNKILSEYSEEFAKYQYIPKYGKNDRRTLEFRSEKYNLKNINSDKKTDC